MIRGGAEYSLGIYITGVDKGSEAESTGLKVRVMPVKLHTLWLWGHISVSLLPFCLCVPTGEVNVAFLNTAFQGRFLGHFGFQAWREQGGCAERNSVLQLQK